MTAIFAGGLLILGGMALAFALYKCIRQQIVLSNARFAVGEVVRNVRRAGDGGWLFRAVIEFKTEAGRTVTFEDPLETSWIRYRRDEKVSVLYDLARPGEARIHSLASLWLPSLIAGILGLLLICVGGLFTALVLLQQCL